MHPIDVVKDKGRPKGCGWVWWGWKGDFKCYGCWM